MDERDPDQNTNHEPAPQSTNTGENMEALDENVSVQKPVSEAAQEPLTQADLEDIRTETQRAAPPKKNGDGLQRVRTYKEDIARAMAGQQASVTSVIAAEERRRTSATPAPQVAQKKTSAFDAKKVLLAAGTVAFFALGAGVLGYFFVFYEKPNVPTQEDVPALIFTEARTNIDTTGKSAREMLQSLRAARQGNAGALGEMTHVFLTVTETAGETSVTRVITAPEFFEAIGANVSGPFLRSLDNDFMVGVHVFNQNQPFLIFKTNSYQHNFAGMLEWENLIYTDLFPFMGRSTNPQTGEPIVLKERFTDRIIQNIDIRALETASEDIELLYAYPNQQTLVVTTNQNTLIEVITRLNTVRVF